MIGTFRRGLARATNTENELRNGVTDTLGSDGPCDCGAKRRGGRKMSNAGLA
jgi:hypothetical protein